MFNVVRWNGSITIFSYSQSHVRKKYCLVIYIHIINMNEPNAEKKSNANKRQSASNKIFIIVAYDVT